MSNWQPCVIHGFMVRVCVCMRREIEGVGIGVVIQNMSTHASDIITKAIMQQNQSSHTLFRWATDTNDNHSQILEF